MFTSTVVIWLQREFTSHSQTCLKALTLPSPLATTPFLLTTLQLACLKVAGFRGQAHTNHRYPLLCSAARPLKISTSCLSHTSLNPDCQEYIEIVWWVSKQNWRWSSLETLDVCCYHSENLSSRNRNWSNIKLVKSDLLRKREGGKTNRSCHYSSPVFLTGCPEVPADCITATTQTLNFLSIVNVQRKAFTASLLWPEACAAGSWGSHHLCIWGHHLIWVIIVQY